VFELNYYCIGHNLSKKKPVEELTGLYLLIWVKTGTLRSNLQQFLRTLVRIVNTNTYYQKKLIVCELRSVPGDKNGGFALNPRFLRYFSNPPEGGLDLVTNRKGAI